MARDATQPAHATAHYAKLKLGIPRKWTKEISSRYSCLTSLLILGGPALRGLIEPHAGINLLD